ncbi:hypothetical protein D9M72_458160 [compost metagenome]
MVAVGLCRECRTVCGFVVGQREDNLAAAPKRFALRFAQAILECLADSPHLAVAHPLHHRWRGQHHEDGEQGHGDHEFDQREANASVPSGVPAARADQHDCPFFNTHAELQPLQPETPVMVVERLSA